MNAAIIVGGHSAVLFFEYFWRTAAVVVEDEAVVVINDFGRAEVALDGGGNCRGGGRLFFCIVQGPSSVGAVAKPISLPPCEARYM